ncbi:GNAT family N-acetyltransferase [Pedobacter cryoconitis]|uniref:Peptidyl-dipeptidase Dcp n=1 Tax=Pedobacter cryoconitis TaxID=188932 RepID=A0A7X0J0Z3_9SPHI|nr:GNAT family N-acetyltransferase [Pedobacter cryoconitis]MBB6499090.1 peptidyl-dipeptidase Dcp [Pedobacter cryoconitis]
MEKQSEITIRNDIRPGDLGMITYLHGVLYANEFQHGLEFESMVAGGLNEFYSTYDINKDRFWIAEKDNQMIGCIALKNRGEAAQLRYFIIRPEYRGFGLGNKFLQLFIAFAKSCKYKSAYLWTGNELNKAQHLYQKFGFKLSEEKPSTAFGKPIIEQRYDLIF